MWWCRAFRHQIDRRIGTHLPHSYLLDQSLNRLGSVPPQIEVGISQLLSQVAPPWLSRQAWRQSAGAVISGINVFVGYSLNKQYFKSVQISRAWLSMQLRRTLFF